MDKVTENWDLIIESVREEYAVRDVPFRTFLQPLKIGSVEGNTVQVTVPSELGSMGVNYIEKNYSLPLQVTICILTGMDSCEVKFSLEDASARKKEKEIPVENPLLHARFKEANLNPKYTFDTFVIGSNNRLAQAAAFAVAEAPGENFNPLFIWGGAGLGKTHLMHSIAHYILEHNDNKKVLYVTSEDFTNELIQIIRSGNNPSEWNNFRNKYRNIDVLLIDDIQFIIGKESTQEEFFHTFNTLHQAKKQIIISSDKRPKDMETLDERFRSRFEMGLIADISSPDYETRMAILHKKEELEGCEIGDEILQYIANNIKSNIRELEGAFNKILAKSRLEKKDISMELAEEVVKDFTHPNEKKIPTIEDIIAYIAQYYGISVTDIKGTRKTSNIAVPRQVAMYVCREITGEVYGTIGSHFGKDHSTVLYACRKIANDINTDESMKNTVHIIINNITG